MDVAGERIWRRGGSRPDDRPAAGRGRAHVLHRPGQGHRALALGLPLTALISIKPIDPAAPDDAPHRLEHVAAIEACHSVAGDESYVLKARVSNPAELEHLLAEIRAAANVSTRTSVVLSTPYENRPPAV